MLYNNTLIIGLFLTIISCNNKREKVVKHYQDGTIKSIHYEINKTPVDSIFTFHSNGEILNKGFYVNGEIEGEITNYYENGKVKKIIHHSKGVPYGDAYFYRSSGNLSEYSVYWKKNTKGYVRKYDSTGMVVFEDGELICDIKLDSLVDGTILNILYANPPNTNTVIKSHLFTKDEKVETKDVDLSFKIGKLTIGSKVDSIVFIAKLVSTDLGEVVKSDTVKIKKFL